MKIVAAMYLDHQDVIQYPIDYVIKSIRGVEEVHFFPSDTPNADAFERASMVGACHFTGRHHAPTGIKISSPGDIPRSMDNCIRMLRAETDADFIVLVQADTLMTDESWAACKWFAKPENLHRAMHLNTQIALLHHYSGGGWGHTIVGKNWNGSFYGDGKGANADGSDISHLLAENRHEFGYAGLVNLEIGSMSIEHYYRHISQHVKTWNENWLLGERLEAYRSGNRELFIRLGLRDLRRRIHATDPLTPSNKIDFHTVGDNIHVLDTRYGTVIDAMGLREEAEMCWAIGREIEKEFDGVASQRLT